LPETYAKYLAGLTTTLDSETVYSAMKDVLTQLGVIMLPMGEAIQKYPDLVKKYFWKNILTLGAQVFCTTLCVMEWRSIRVCSTRCESILSYRSILCCRRSS